MARITYDLTPAVTPTWDSGSFVRFAALPSRQLCNDLLPVQFVRSSGERWNCNLCGAGDQRYFIPFVYGDILPVQFALRDLVNTDLANPTVGFKTTTNATGTPGSAFYCMVEMLIDCVTLYSDAVDAFCIDWWVGYDPKFGALQTIFVDTALLPIGTQSFALRVTNYAADGSVANVFVSEPYNVPSCNTPTVLINGYYTVKDALENRYQVPTAVFHTPVPPVGYQPTPYYTSVRIVADFDLASISSEKEYNDQNIELRSTHINRYVLTSTEKLPPYMVQLLGVATQAERVTVESKDWSGEFSNWSALEKNNDFGRMFLPVLTAEKRTLLSTKECK